jgi:hypothetical protein
MFFFHRFAFPNQGAIAQLVEQRTENPCVPGSIPGGTTKNPVQQLHRVFAFTGKVKVSKAENHAGIQPGVSFI